MSMPSLYLKRINLDLIYPPFLEKVLEAIAACKDQGAWYFGTLGFRTYPEQMKLWTQGRTTPGPIVTKAKAGESAHNFGLAIDFVRSMEAERIVPDWTLPAYDVLGVEAKKAGLVWGGDWKSPDGKPAPDRPHVQWPGYVTKFDMAPLDHLYKTSKDIKAVWQYVDKTCTA